MWETIIVSTLAGIFTLVGILLIRLWHEHALRYSHYINSFAAGMILAVAVSELLPHALESSEHAGLYALAGFAAFLALETFLIMHSGAEVHYSPRQGAGAARGVVFFWGLLLHSLLDGVILAVGFSSGRQIGLVIAFAVIGHELPEGITTFSLLLQKLKERTAMMMAVAVAVATPVGGLIGLALLPVLSTTLMGPVLALVAGSFVYIAATDIVPEIREQKAPQNIILLIAGIALLAGVNHLLGH